MKPSNTLKQALLSCVKARFARLAAQPMFENAMKQAPDEALLAIHKYVSCFHDQLLALGCLAEHAMEHAENKSVIREFHKVMDAVAPQVATEKRKAQLAWIKKAEDCSEVEKKAALLKTDGMTLSEIAKRLPHIKGKPMTRQGVQKVLRRFEKKTGQHRLSSTGTYREQEQAKVPLKETRVVGGVYWKNAEERNKPEEDSEDATDS